MWYSHSCVGCRRQNTPCINLQKRMKNLLVVRVIRVLMKKLSWTLYEGRSCAYATENAFFPLCRDEIRLIHHNGFGIVDMLEV